MKGLPLSTNTVQRCVDEMWKKTFEMWKKTFDIYAYKLSIQHDESTFRN